MKYHLLFFWIFLCGNSRSPLISEQSQVWKSNNSEVNFLMKQKLRIGSHWTLTERRWSYGRGHTRGRGTGDLLMSCSSSSEMVWGLGTSWLGDQLNGTIFFGVTKWKRHMLTLNWGLVDLWIRNLDPVEHCSLFTVHQQTSWMEDYLKGHEFFRDQMKQTQL